MPTIGVYSLQSAHSYIAQKRVSRIPKVATGRLLSAADKALTPDTIKASWRDTGLWPLNEAFLAAHPSILHRPDPVPVPVAVAAAPSFYSRQGHFIGSGRLLTAPESLVAIRQRVQKSEEKKEAIEQRAVVREEKKRKLAEKPSSAKKPPKRQARVPLGVIDMNRPVYQSSDAPAAAACAVPALRVAAAHAIPAFATTALPCPPIPAYVSFSLSSDCHDL